MKRQVAGVLLVFSAVLAGGCANSQASKSNASIAALSPVQETPNPSQEHAAQQTDHQAMVSQDIQESAADKAERAEREARLARERKAGLERIYFNLDSASLSEQARNTLVKNAELLRQNKHAKIRVEGHCDERGSDDYNLALGEKRAKQALQYLTNMGVPEERMSAISYGKEKPVEAGHDESSWAKNRRGEFVIIP